MDRSDLMKFWRLLADAKSVGTPSQLTAEEVRKMAEAKGLPEHEIEDVLRGFLEFMRQEGGKNPSGPQEPLGQKEVQNPGTANGNPDTFSVSK